MEGKLRLSTEVCPPWHWVPAHQDRDDEPFTNKMARLFATLEQQFAQGAKLEAAIKQSLSTLTLENL